MMENRLVETLIGASVLAVAALFFAFAYSSADVQSGNGYNLIARFDNAGGVTPGTDISVSGIKVGTVTKVALNPDTYRAEVTLNITSDIELPDDTSIKVTSDGLLGGSYLALEPGGGLDMLQDGDEIAYSQGSVDLMSLIGKAVFAFTEGGDDKSADGAKALNDAPGTDHP
ncbi:MAG: outer membrane lipid asymmetry maintenance protein MlaD [Alphaproteobacteria bacterium]